MTKHNPPYQPPDGFERELARRLRPVEAPEALTRSILARVAAEPRPVMPFQLLRRRWIGSVAATLLAVSLLFAGVEHRLERERAQARERAERDFARSVEITDRTLAQTRERLQRAGIAIE